MKKPSPGVDLTSAKNDMGKRIGLTLEEVADQKHANRSGTSCWDHLENVESHDAHQHL